MRLSLPGKKKKEKKKKEEEEEEEEEGARLGSNKKICSRWRRSKTARW